MSFVQQEDQIKHVWIKYHVASGDIVEVSHRKFEGVEEIDPIVRKQVAHQKRYDPLGDYR